MITAAYRIFEVKNGEIMSLFHGTNGSRKLPVNRWIKADKKLVRDGRGQNYYESGFHVFLDETIAREFFDKKFRIRDNREVRRCFIKLEQIRRKRPSSEIMLVDEIYIPREGEQ